MHSFQNFIVRLIPNHPPPLETRIWKLVVRALVGSDFQRGVIQYGELGCIPLFSCKSQHRIPPYCLIIYDWLRSTG